MVRAFLIIAGSLVLALSVTALASTEYSKGIKDQPEDYEDDEEDNIQ